MSLNVQGIPNMFDHNVIHTGGQNVTHTGGQTTTHSGSIINNNQQDYGVTPLSSNSLFTDKPQITSTDPNLASSIGTKFLSGLLGGFFSTS